MNKIWTLIFLLASTSIFFSCSTDEADNGMINQKEFTPVTLKLTSGLGVKLEEKSGSIETKAGQSDIYTANELYLMIEDNSAPEGWKSYPMIVQKNGETASFDFYVSTISLNEIAIDNGVAEPIKIKPTTRLYFSSTKEMVIQTGMDAEKLTPNGNPTLKPYDGGLFRSDFFTIEVLPNGIKMFDQSFTEGNDISFTLIVYRQTGLLKVNLVLFRKSQEKPSLVTAGHFKPNCADVEYWQITPYLNGYTGAIRMDGEPIDPPVTGAYMLSDGYLPFELREVNEWIGDVHFDHKTHGAFSNAAPSIFSGSLSGATLEFMIVNTKPAIPEKKMAVVPLENVELGYNELRTINVFINIKALEENFTNLKATQLIGDEEELPDIFYCWK